MGRIAGGGADPGNPGGHAPVPAAARAVDTSHPTRVTGTGTPRGCTSRAVVSAVAAGGVIRFSCGPGPVTIRMTATAKVRNAAPDVVLDGGGKVTLSGGGRHRILYLNTGDRTEGGGGGAIFVRGGRLKVVNSRFVRCHPTGPDLGGAAIRVLSQYHGLPVYVVRSTFGGAPGQGGSCSNGGALSSIGVSWVILNSVLSYTAAVGTGANPARGGTPGGGAIFFVSNDRTGTLRVEDSSLCRNRSAGFETRGYPGVFFLGAGRPLVTGSRLG